MQWVRCLKNNVSCVVATHDQEKEAEICDEPRHDCDARVTAK